VDLAIMLLVAVPYAWWLGFAPGWRLLLLPIPIAACVVLATGIGIGVGALSVRYRDFKHVVPFALQVGLYLSPVGFSATLVPSHWRALYGLNPVVALIEAFRWTMLAGDASVAVWNVLPAVLTAIPVVLVGVVYFRRTERAFADVI
jgi:lipopolysaccharide transport system permease protein